MNHDGGGRGLLDNEAERKTSRPRQVRRWRWPTRAPSRGPGEPLTESMFHSELKSAYSLSWIVRLVSGERPVLVTTTVVEGWLDV